MLAIERGGVFAEPTEARLGRPFALEDGTGIDVCASDGALAKFPDRIGDGARLLEDHIVIIGTERVGGDAPAQLGAPIELGRRR